MHFSQLSSANQGATLILFACLLFSIVAALVKASGQNIPVIEVLFLRQSVMLALLLPNMIKTGRIQLRTQRSGLHFVRLFLALAAMTMGFTAFVHLPLADATAITFAKAFFLTLLAAFVLGEKVGKHRYAAVVVGFIGVLIMLRPGTDGFNLYSLLAFLSAACAAGTMASIRALSQTESTATLMTWQILGVWLLTLPFTVVYWTWPNPTEWLQLFFIGLLSFWGQRFNINGFRLGEASLLASLDYVRLVFVAILGFLFFGQLPQMATWVGAGLILIAALYTIYREEVNKRHLIATPAARGGINNL